MIGLLAFGPLDNSVQDTWVHAPQKPILRRVGMDNGLAKAVVYYHSTFENMLQQ